MGADGAPGIAAAARAGRSAGWRANRRDAIARRPLIGPLRPLEAFRQESGKATLGAGFGTADGHLLKLGKAIPQSSLRLRPMEGHDDLCEMRAGGQNRFILRRAQDAKGDYFIVEDVGPHDIYRRWNMR